MKIEDFQISGVCIETTSRGVRYVVLLKYGGFHVFPEGATLPKMVTDYLNAHNSLDNAVSGLLILPEGVR